MKSSAPTCPERSGQRCTVVIVFLIIRLFRVVLFCVFLQALLRLENFRTTAAFQLCWGSWQAHFQVEYSRVPIRRHSSFIRHTPFIRPNTFSKKWAVPYNWISMSKWSTFRYKFVSINLHLLYRPRHMWLIFRLIHFSSCVPLRLFRTPLLIGTRE